MGIEFNRVNPADFQAEVNKSSAAPQAEATEQTFNFEASEADRNMGLGVQSNGGRKVVRHPSGRYQVTENGQTKYYDKDGTPLSQKNFESQCGQYLENGVWLKTEKEHGFLGLGKERDVKYYDIDYTQYDPNKDMLFDKDIKKRTIATNESGWTRFWRGVGNALRRGDDAIREATGGHIQRGASGTTELVGETAAAAGVLYLGGTLAPVIVHGAKPVAAIASSVGLFAACDKFDSEVGEPCPYRYDVTKNADGSFTATFKDDPVTGYTYTFRGDESDLSNELTDPKSKYNMLNAMMLNAGLPAGGTNELTLGVEMSKASWNIAGQESVPNQGFSLTFPKQELNHFTKKNEPLTAECSILGQTFKGKVTTDGDFVKIGEGSNAIYIKQEDREIDGNLIEKAMVVYVGGKTQDKATYVIANGGENDAGGNDVAIAKLNNSAEGTTFYYYGEKDATNVPMSIYNVAYSEEETHVRVSGGIF